jgi:molybdopterin converting factor small subunit
VHPSLTDRLAPIRWAQNEEFVDASAALAAGDVVALLPPVAGG